MPDLSDMMDCPCCPALEGMCQPVEKGTKTVLHENVMNRIELIFILK